MSKAKQGASAPKGTAVTVKKADQLPANVMDAFAAQSGKGLEKIRAQDIVIPRLTIIQSLSPQVQKSKPDFIKGAKVGDFLNTATGKLYDELLVVPVHFDVKWLEWAPRKEDKGLVAIHDDDTILQSCEKNDDGQWETGEGNTVIESRQFYVLDMLNGGASAFMALQKTQAKKARKWMTAITNERGVDSKGKEFMPPIFYRSYRITGKEESNKQGEWIGYIIEPGELVPEMKNWQDVMSKAMRFRESIIAGESKANLNETRSASDDGKM